VVLVFSEQVASRLGGIEVVAPDGRHVDEGPAGHDTLWFDDVPLGSSRVGC
jgi:hypothetical protein